jgi:hypothetical protein
MKPTRRFTILHVVSSERLLTARSEIRRLAIVLKIILDQTVGIHDNNFKYKLLIPIIVKSKTSNEFIPIRKKCALIASVYPLTVCIEVTVALDHTQ